MKEKYAIFALTELYEVLTEHKITFWLESGTLLGAIREKCFISWDYDMDFGTWERFSNKMRILTKEFCKRGYETYYSPYHNLITIKKGEIDIQLVFWRKQNGKAIAPLRYIENRLGFFLSAITWALLFSHEGKVNKEQIGSLMKRYKFLSSKIANILPEVLRLKIVENARKIAIRTGNRRGLVVTPSHYFENLSEINFYGISFKSPTNAESYLEYYYGKDWQTPKKEWVYVRKDRKLISKTERIGEKWESFRVSNNFATTQNKLNHR